MAKKSFAYVISAIGAAVLATGCATKPASEVAAPVVDQEVARIVAESGERMSKAMLTLAATRSNTHGVIYKDDYPVPAELNTPITINWAGPVDQLVKQVAELTGFAYVQPVGKAPATVVIVTIAAKDLKAHDVLANAGQQAGSAADIVVNPDSKKLYVKYPPTTRSGGYATVVEPAAK